MEKDQFIVFSKSNLYLITKNVYRYKSKILFQNSNYIIIQKYIEEENNKIDIFITISIENDGYEKFIRGFLYKNNKEYLIKNYALYTSLQIAEWAYDNIGICTFEDDIYNELSVVNQE
jgi:hypothetical protein